MHIVTKKSDSILMNIDQIHFLYRYDQFLSNWHLHSILLLQLNWLWDSNLSPKTDKKIKVFTMRFYLWPQNDLTINVIQYKL